MNVKADIISCDETKDCIAINPYFECKPALESEKAIKNVKNTC